MSEQAHRMKKLIDDLFKRMPILRTIYKIVLKKLS